MSMKNHVNILFRLAQDAEGYPPVAVERIWATKASTGYMLDNIPFFTRQATFGDTVSVTDESGTLWFSGVLVRSGNSLLRVVLFDTSRVDEVRKGLSNLGCTTEWDQPHKLVGVNVPDTASLAAVQAYLQKESAQGWLDYEEPILRQ